ncbi:MAG: HAMP domain-containing sensor histidine kinase [bacterium]
MSSLYFRLLVVIVGVSLLAVIMVALISSRTTTTEFQRFVKSDDGTDVGRFAGELQSYYQQSGNWDGVAPVLDRISQLSGKQLVLTGASQGVVAVAPASLRDLHIRFMPDGNLELERRRESGGKLRVEQFVLANPTHSELHNSAGEIVGELYLVPVTNDELTQNEKRFLGTVNKSLLLAGAASAALALLAAFFLARRILRPVNALTSAALRMRSGDLTVRVPARGSDELADLARSFNSMADALVHTEELRRNLVSDVAHELRTPLSRIRCQLEAMQDGLVAPNHETISAIHDEAMQLNRLVEDLQELALADTAQFSLNLQAVSVKDQAEQVARSLTSLANERAVAIDVCISDDLPLVMADRGRLRQILANLLQNAITHTAAGGKATLSAQLDNKNENGTNVVGRTSQGDTNCSWLEVRVEDTGDGIAPEHLPHIFDRFFRTDESRSRATGGSGLGLAIVKQLVELHGGRVWAESQPGQGTIIRFTLPVATS